MKQKKLNSLLSAVAVGFIALVTPVFGQTGKVDVDDPKFDVLQSPEFGGNTNKKNFKPKDWLEAEAKIKIEMPKGYDKAFIDRVTVKWKIAVKNPEGKGYILLEKEVNHVNVPVDEDVYVSIYISPNTIKRISGNDRASKSIIKSVGGEILVNGQAAHNKSGQFSTDGKPGWWNSPSMSRNDSIPLLNKDETPFKALWYDRYAEIEKKR
ncbi:hypothetical protein SAMN02745181_2341 [Rubritalea squalenifaciens DSM 18772]|uniref:Uncharacterized protein n=1 Tax=Rubritalea squalenifaciens DSM 18772 TaxID=1123071 RepID=A0A1M6LAJ8_9BACT|nr:Amuc_1102 family pilus-like protein [Rubritalea squalenifaciens]SHJ68185.1 hypothetical protein SAMN02745181_2341 [Rubritalea squalenifaciens DSM 18772]